MGNNKLFSIIMPVYNSEETLAECIQSVLDQTCPDFELIIVNDGSKDKSWEIIEKFTKNDLRIKAISIENSGVSHARNIGLKLAVGDYITFVDSDDIIDLHALKVFETKIKEKNYDIVFGNQAIFEKQRNHIVQRYGLQNECSLVNATQDDIIRLCFFRKIHNVVWGNVYRHSVIKKNEIQFNSLYSMNEDGDWLYRVVLASNLFSAVDYTTYYQRRDPSTSNYHKIGKKYAESSINVNSYWFDYFNLQYDGTSKQVIRGQIANSYLFSGFRIAGIQGRDLTEMKEKYLSRKDIFSYVTGYKNKILIMVLTLFGFSLFLKILNFLIKITNRNN
jgi:glycosyltransferase involved in cell wall biosynthesis